MLHSTKLVAAKTFTGVHVTDIHDISICECDCKHKFLKTVRKGALRKANKSAQIFVNIDNKLHVFLPLVIRQSVGHIVH